MTVHNADVARIFNRLADLLEIEGANPFRVRAYRDAARIVGDLPQEASTLIVAGKHLSELHGIGKDLAGKIEEIVATGHLALLEETERRVPEGLLDLLTLGPLGPKGSRHSTTSSGSRARMISPPRRRRARSMTCAASARRWKSASWTRLRIT